MFFKIPPRVVKFSFHPPSCGGAWQMFCPVCKYEFRRGFTHCNQCDVDLVDQLPAEKQIDHSAPEAHEQMDHPVLLWSGANAGIFSALTSALDQAEIPYNKEDLDARLMFTSQHGDLEIWVPAANLAQAQPLLDSIRANPLNADGVASTVLPPEGDFDPALDAENEDAYDVRGGGVTRELYPEEATAEVWSGADGATAEMLKSCLGEVGIACYLQHPGEEAEAGSATDFDARRGASRDGHSGARTALGNASSAEGNGAIFAVRVLPEDESPAVQIVRQVITAAAPE